MSPRFLEDADAVAVRALIPSLACALRTIRIENVEQPDRHASQFSQRAQPSMAPSWKQLSLHRSPMYELARGISIRSASTGGWVAYPTRGLTLTVPLCESGDGGSNARVTPSVSYTDAPTMCILVHHETPVPHQHCTHRSDAAVGEYPTGDVALEANLLMDGHAFIRALQGALPFLCSMVPGNSATRHLCSMLTSLNSENIGFPRMASGSVSG